MSVTREFSAAVWDEFDRVVALQRQRLDARMLARIGDDSVRGNSKRFEIPTLRGKERSNSNKQKD